jgi:hypothetical protein
MIMTPTTREQAHDHENGARSQIPELANQISEAQPSIDAMEKGLP